MKVITPEKVIITLLCAVAIFGCQASTSFSGSNPEAEKKGLVLAEVNSGTITTDDLNRELKYTPEQFKSLAETQQGRREILDTMVIRELILQQAAKDGLDKSAEIEEKVQDLKKRLIVEAFLKKKVEAYAQVSDADVKNYYEQNKDKFKVDEQIRASHILVKSEKEAGDILDQIKAGANFEELARKRSACTDSSSRGGDLGWFGKGTMVPSFEEVALELKEGQISDVVKTEFGYHIVKRTGKRAAGLLPLAEVKEQIKDAIIPSRQQDAFQKIKEELKKNGNYSIKEDVLKGLENKPVGKKQG